MPHPLEEQIREIDTRKEQGNPEDGVLTYSPAQHDTFMRQGANAWEFNDMLRGALRAVAENVAILYTAADQVQVTANKLSIEGVVIDSFDYTADIDDDLDTGTKAASTFYYLWAVATSRGEQYKIIYSLSRTAPAMPESYVLKRLMGVVLLDGSSNIYPFLWDYGWYLYDTAGVTASPFLAINGVAALGYTAQSLSAAVPPGAVRVLARIRVLNNGPAAANLHLRVRPTGSSLPDADACDILSICNVQPNECIGTISDEIWTDTSQSVDWVTGVATHLAYFNIRGFYFPVQGVN